MLDLPVAWLNEFIEIMINRSNDELVHEFGVVNVAQELTLYEVGSLLFI